MIEAPQVNAIYPEETDALNAKRICFDCVGEACLSDEIRRKGARADCSYCKKTHRTWSIGELAKRLETAFEQHYVRTPDQPNDLEFMLQRDPELNYEWYRGGERVNDAIMDAANIPSASADDVQRILAHQHADFSADATGEETEFADGSYYERKGASDEAWQKEWRSFENSLKTKARFFSRTASKHLASIFDGIDALPTRDGRPPVVDAGPGTDFRTLYRARVFQCDGKLDAALCRPDQQLGPPPAFLAVAGRMNAHGISVFYGANDPKVAVAEVRPPVGSRVAVAQFQIIRKLRLLDLTALCDVRPEGSIFDVGFSARLEHAQFLRSLSGRMTRPVMPDDEPFDYLVTQAVADFLATESSASIDGIIFPSVQAAGHVLNIVLFHKSACVEPMDIPEGTQIKVLAGQVGEEGWEEDYSVSEAVPPAPDEADKRDTKPWRSDLVSIAADPSQENDSDMREATLRIVPESITVHRVRRVEFETEEFPVRRHRREKLTTMPDF
jgi:hypothetical protein